MNNLKAYFEKELSIDELRCEFQKIEREWIETGDNDAALISYRILSFRVIKSPRWGEGELIDLDERDQKGGRPLPCGFDGQGLPDRAHHLLD